MSKNAILNLDINDLKMELSKKLKDQGWFLTDEGIKKLIAAAMDENDVRKIIKCALDFDFRDIASGALPAKRDDTIPGKIVLQVQKVRNISAPKANEESKTSPRFLQIDLTDGHNALQSLELETISALSLNLPPGTKIYFSAERLQLLHGYLVLRGSELQVLGGRVEALVEKWEVARTMQKYARSGRHMGGAGGPPPWIAFGKKLDVGKETQPSERNFKSLQAAQADKDKDSKENFEFNAMRSEAIAVAAKAGAKKVFGGGGQQILDHNVKKILEKGYSEEEANQALRATHNNLERALYNLKRRNDYKRHDDAQTEVATTSKMGRGGSSSKEVGGRGRGMASIKEEASAAKPAANVSLFDFLTDKLPASTTDAASTQATITTTSATLKPTQQNYTNTGNKYDKYRSEVTKSKVPSNISNVEAAAARSKFENNISSSFAEHRPTAPQRGGRGNNERYERSERPNRDVLYPPNERGGNSRFTSGRGGRGGRGGNSTSSSRGYEENASGSNRNVARNTNSTQSNRNNRSSQERATVGAGGGSEEHGRQESVGKGGYDKRRNNERSSNSSNDTKNFEKNRYPQRENNNKGYDGGRRPNGINNNNIKPSTAPTITTATTKSNISTNKNNNTENKDQINEIIESTTKLKLDKQHEEKGGERRPRRNNTTQQPATQQAPKQQQQKTIQTNQQYAQQQQQQPLNQNAYTQLPNGYTYDPSKIIGFQSKETNDFALTLLKSQGLTSSNNAVHQIQQQQQLQPTPPPQLQAQSTASFNATPFVLSPNVQPSNLAHDQFGWLWKPGDLCCAKYWDDGRYYEAEITAVSDTTCVVFFLGYGNHEEVLKSDCLPITDVNHQPINNSFMQQQAAHNAGALTQNNDFQRGNSTRFRGERQMYVPPPFRHKREN